MNILDEYGLSLEHCRMIDGQTDERVKTWFSLRQIIQTIADDELAREAVGMCMASAKWPETTISDISVSSVPYSEIEQLTRERKAKVAEDPLTQLSYEYRKQYACKVCSNVPDESGTIEHGRGCHTQSQDGGGTSFVEFVCECHERDSSFRCPLCVSQGVKGHMQV